MAPTARFVQFLVIGAFFLGGSFSTVNAEILIHGTRLIYQADSRDATLKVTNTGAAPVLIQSWIDDGDINKRPEEIRVPFQLTPTLSRLDPGNAAVLRVVYSKEPLPDDRETVFWLNMLEVPAQREGDNNRLAFTFRHRLKMFFRPPGLKVEVHSAAERLSWKFEPPGRLQVSNPTPYYLSFSKVEVHGSGRTVALGAGMVAPFSQESFAWPGSAGNTPQNASVRFEVVNDFGGRTALEKVLR
ncbi:fimbria/pilus periplasmic chaperone [Pseudomonas protegens]|uniref:fimbrial biogenesis chaperone n=1 Tax=Pseudomonas TaxID=286 RepID=UPI00320A548A